VRAPVRSREAGFRHEETKAQRRTKVVVRVRAGIALLALAVVCGAGCGRDGGPAPGGAAPAIVKTASGIEMVLVPAGTFEMGSPRGKADEAPVHTVRVDDFLMDRTEVTQEQFARLEMPDPSHFKDPKNPVEQVNWPQAVLFCNRRSEAEGLKPCYNEETVACDVQASGYRLPTEAEWEYACRAGTATDYSFGGDPRKLDEHAWFADNAFKKTHPVGRKRPNPWGLFDMHGNVGEWCHDVYDKDYYKKSPSENPRGPADGKLYVLRGGAWTSRPDQLRSSARMGDNPGFADACLARDAIGFRCVRQPDAGGPAPAK
jgi:formylglycine-generating enzyme required for sulfatase activity